MKDDLLWVYEGLTNYYGELLSARAGPDLAGGMVRRDCVGCDGGQPSEPHVAPLQDSADAAPFLYTAGGGWAGWRRQSWGRLPAFYSEGTLIWLEADVTIRRLTNGRKTLDDFCALFHGQNDNGKVWMKPFDADEVYRTLNTVAAYDWRGFFESGCSRRAPTCRLAAWRTPGSSSPTPTHRTCSRIRGRSTAV